MTLASTHLGRSTTPQPSRLHQEEGQFHALGEVVQDYGPDDDWESLVLPRLGHIPTRELLRLTGP
jgi:hypothetical protein